MRTYAEYLGLNGDDVVAIFNEQWNRSAGHRAEPALAADAGLGRPVTPTGLFSLWVALACLLLAVSAVLYLMGGSGGGHRASPPPTTHAAGHASRHRPDDQRHASRPRRRSRPACG